MSVDIQGGWECCADAVEVKEVDTVRLRGEGEAFKFTLANKHMFMPGVTGGKW